MPDTFRKTGSGVTATSKDTGKSYHSDTMGEAKKAAGLRDYFKHLKEQGKLPKTR